MLQRSQAMARPQARGKMAMAAPGSVFARDDTLLGACHAIAEDFGFSPDWLRVSLALILFWNPPLAFAGYGLCIALAVVSRTLVPEPRATAGEPQAAAQEEPEESLKLAA